MTQQHSDPVIDEIRAVRHRISARCNHDPVQLVAYYMELQEQYGDRLVETPGESEGTSRSAVRRPAQGGG